MDPETTEQHPQVPAELPPAEDLAPKTNEQVLDLTQIAQAKLESLKQQLPSHLIELATLDPQAEPVVELPPEPKPKAPKPRRFKPKRDLTSSSSDFDPDQEILSDQDLLQDEMQLQEGYFNFDLLVKDIPKLHVDTTQIGDDYCLYNPPFLVLYDKPVDEEMTQANLNEKLKVPHQQELMEFYEDF